MTLKIDGTIEYKGQVYKDTLCDGVVCKIMIDGKEVVLEKGMYSFSNDSGLIIDGFSYDDEKGWSIEEIKDYPICTTKKFRDCPISVEDSLNGSYLAFLKKNLSKPFDPSKFKNPMPDLIRTDKGVIIYDPSTAPNFKDHESAPFRRNVTAGVVTMEDGKQYMLLPIEYPDPRDPTNPQKNVWVLGVQNLFGVSSGTVFPENLVAREIDWWNNKLNIAPIHTDYSSSPLNELIIKSQTQFPDIEERFDRFVAGDTTALDGVIVGLDITLSSGHWYE